MSQVEMYLKPECPYCQRATNLLEERGAMIHFIRLDLQPERRDEMRQRSGGRHTVPQIFINDRHIGGCDDLVALDLAGELNELLVSA